MSTIDRIRLPSMGSALLPVLLSALMGCPAISSDDHQSKLDAIDEGDPENSDADGDGFTTADGDCNDDDAEIYPGADERCDEVDNDCDDEIDEDDAVDTRTWYLDYDGDGYGDPDAHLEGCAAPANYTADSTDCDDRDNTVFPGGVEMCDGIDNDCDEKTDEGDAVDPTTWYADADWDGYRDSETTQEACDKPDEFVSGTAEVDCDDTDATINPGADELCDDIDHNCDGEPITDAIDPVTSCLDDDGDGHGDEAACSTACDVPSGHVDNATDCDDTDAAIHPDADELCDTIDNDCDDEIDEDDAIDAVTWYADDDGDGYRDETTSSFACAAPSGTISDAAEVDCDDTDSAIHPDADEFCDDTDNDCDGETDEDDAIDATTWYADDDGDGYGDPEVTSAACDVPDDFVDNNTDCDDTDTSVSPAGTEVCGDEVDEDCDGDTPICRPTDEMVPLGFTDPLGDWTWSNHYGASVSFAGDLNGDGFDDYLVGSPQVAELEDEPAIFGGYGLVTIQFGTPDGSASVSHPVFTGDTETTSEEYSGFGQTVLGHIEITGDEHYDIVVAAPNAAGEEFPTEMDVSGFPSPTGAVYIFAGPFESDGAVSGGDGLDSPFLTLKATLDLTTVKMETEFGRELDVLDANDDGNSDLLISTILDVAVVGAHYQLYLLLGPQEPYEYAEDCSEDDDVLCKVGLTPERARVQIYSDGTDSSLLIVSADGVPLAQTVGDTNGDGFDDIIWSINRLQIGYSDSLIQIVHGQVFDSDEDILDRDADIICSEPSADAGWTIFDRWANEIAVGDVDGDGSADLVVSSPDQEIGGTIQILDAPTDVGPCEADDFTKKTLSGDSEGAQIGRKLLITDLDADGVDDLVFTVEPSEPYTDLGAVVVIYGGDALADGGTLDVGMGPSSTRDAYFLGEESDDVTNPLQSDGVSLAGGGDANGDGFGDLLIGNALHDLEDAGVLEIEGHDGRVYLFGGGLAP